MFYNVGLVQNILKKVDIPISESSGTGKRCCSDLSNYQRNMSSHIPDIAKVSYTSNAPQNHAVMFRPLNEEFVDTGSAAPLNKAICLE